MWIVVLWLLPLESSIAESSYKCFYVTSSFPAHLRILLRFSMLRPIVILRSQRYLLNPFSFMCKDTKATCDESIAWSEIPSLFMSKLTFLTRSLMASTIFLKVTPFSKRASNIFKLNIDINHYNSSKRHILALNLNQIKKKKQIIQSLN